MDGRVMRAAPWVVGALTIGIFVLDLVTPIRVGAPMLYVIPLVLTLFTAHDRDPLVVCILVTSLIWVEWFVKPQAGIAPHGALNRVLGTLVVWTITAALLRHRRIGRRLIQTETDKNQAKYQYKTERVERAHAEALMIAAQEARFHADTAALGAAVGRHRAEAQLRLSELRLDGIIQSAMDAIITLDQDQKVILFNRAAEQMFGCSVADAMGQPLDRFLPARFRDAHRESIQAFGRSGVTSRKMGKLGRVAGCRVDGSEFPIEAAISHASVDGTQFFTVILRDTSEREQAAEELRKQHELIEAVLETAGALVVVLDSRGRILRFNRACEQTTGYSSEEVAGKAVWDFLLVPEEVEPVKAVFARLTTGEHRNEYENVWVSKDGRRRRIAWSNAVITSEEGVVNYVVGTGIDVTILKQIQERLRKTERLAELGTVASGMAHEIGTPMNVILGRAEYLLERVTEEPIRKGLQTIVTQVERITRVMNQLLTFARRKPPEPRPLAFTQVIEGNLDVFQERLEKNHIIVQTSFDSPCPLVLADADQMSQVVINLVMNAIQAMPDGGVLRFGLVPVDDMVRITVSDTGLGIAREAIHRIFEPFFTTKEFGKGTGLGLTVVKEIIEEHRGSITVESEPGTGTTFAILLPVYRPSAVSR